MANNQLLTALTDQGRAWYARIIDVLAALSPTDLDTIARQAENIGRVVRTEQQRRAAREGAQPHSSTGGEEKRDD